MTCWISLTTLFTTDANWNHVLVSQLILQSKSYSNFCDCWFSYSSLTLRKPDPHCVVSWYTEYLSLTILQRWKLDAFLFCFIACWFSIVVIFTLKKMDPHCVVSWHTEYLLHILLRWKLDVFFFCFMS